MAALGVVLALLAGADPADAAKKDKALEELEKNLPPAYRAFLEEIAVLISDDEKKTFLTLNQDYQRDAFIEKFWKARDPYPDTGRNELRERWKARLETARTLFPDLAEERARLFLLNGEPTELIDVECSTILWPTQIWFYKGSDRVRGDFFLIFYRRWGAGIYRLWHPSDSLEPLFQDGSLVLGGNNQRRLQQIESGCFRGDELAAIFGFVLNQGVFEYQNLVSQATTQPDPPKGEWVDTFESYSTDLPSGVTELPVTWEVSFPGRRQSRTALQSLLLVPKEAAALAELAGYRSYNFVLTGEVLEGERLFDSFRYKFDLPADEVPGDKVAMAFLRYLRPGSYRVVLKVEDLNAKGAFRGEREVVVPALDGAPPPPADPETARLLAESSAAVASGDVTIKILDPPVELISGLRRIETKITGQGIEQVTFTLDGKAILTKKKPPFSVELDLGSLPRSRVLEATAYSAAGELLASDRLVLNASSHRFAVRLTEPRRGAIYKQSLRAAVDVAVPEAARIERVEIFLNESRVATLYQPPWEQPVVLPGDGSLAYVQAVAYLEDGNSSQDLVFVNAPEIGEEVKIQYVELYTTVVDRQGRPVTDVTQADLAVFEDGAAQEIRRFEKVEDQPIYATALLDVSASMEPSILAARDAALLFFQQAIRPKDRGAVVTFNDRPALAVPFTKDLKKLAAGLTGLKAERGTALFDSVIFALHYFNGVKGQRALLLLSDGKDESSKFQYADAVEYARRAGVTIYAIGLALPKGEPRRKLTGIAEETGGRSFFVEGAAELPAVYRQIEQELRSQYLLTYQSSNTAVSGQFRTIEVKVGRPGLEAKTLRGYYP